MVVIKSKNNKKWCIFFAVPGNGQALFRMPDTAALKLINVNIDSLQAEVAECKTNIEQETHMVEESCANMDRESKMKQGTNGQDGQNNVNKATNYSFSSPNIEADKRKGIELTWEVHNTFGDVCNGIGCFEGTFSLQLKLDSKPYQGSPRCVAYVLQKPFKEELEHLKKMDIITPLGVDKLVEWCNSFMLVPKANGKVRLCLDLVRLNQTLIRHIQRGPTLNDILCKLNNVKYMSIIE